MSLETNNDEISSNYVALITDLSVKLAFAIISISGVHALKTYLSGDLSLENIQIVTMVAVIHFTFVLSAIGISFAERLTRDKTH